MTKLPSESPRPTYTVVSLVLLDSATNGSAAGSPMVSVSYGGQPCQLRATPLTVPVPLVGKFVAVQTKPNQKPVRRSGGSHSDSPGAPEPSLPSSAPACRPRPPSMVVVCSQVPRPPGPQLV